MMTRLFIPTVLLASVALPMFANAAPVSTVAAKTIAVAGNIQQDRAAASGSFDLSAIVSVRDRVDHDHNPAHEHNHAHHDR